jgi:hypothetical protein
MIDGEGAFDLDALPELLTRGGGRVEKVDQKISSAAALPFWRPQLGVFPKGGRSDRSQLGLLS